MAIKLDDFVQIAESHGSAFLEEAPCDELFKFGADLAN
jgi:hypothetical protein